MALVSKSISCVFEPFCSILIVCLLQLSLAITPEVLAIDYYFRHMLWLFPKSLNAAFLI